MGDAAVEMIDEAPRRRDEHVEALRQSPDLRAMRYAAEDDGDRKLHLRSEGAEALGDLARKFARRAQHQDAGAAAGRLLRIGEQLIENRQGEGGGFAGAGLGDPDEIAASHEVRNGLRLNGSWLDVAEFAQGKEKGRGEAESGEILQVGIFR